MDTLKIKNILHTTYPFLKPKDLDILLSISQYQVLKNKVPLIQAGTSTQKCFFILSGMMRGYYINRKGEEINIFLRPECTVSGPPDDIFNKAETKYTFESILESHLLVFEYATFQNASEQNPNITKMYFAALQENLQTLIFRVESLVDKSPEERYEDLLNRSPQFFQTAFNKHIANYLGITPNSLSRILKRRKEAKI